MFNKFCEVRDVIINNIIIENVHDYIYLGQLQYPDGNIGKEIKRRIKLAWRTFSLTWAILQNGQIAVRTNVSISKPEGENWVLLKDPVLESKIIQISVGTNVVWAVTEDHRAWFRRGLATNPGRCNVEIFGNGWINVCDSISRISVTSNDQVWAIGSFSDHRIYYRKGVVPCDLMGKSWCPVKAPIPINQKLTQSSSWVADRSPIFEHESANNTSHSAPHRLYTGFSLLGVEAQPDTDYGRPDPNFERDAFLEKQNDTLKYVFQNKWIWVEAGSVEVSPNQTPNWFHREGILNEVNDFQWVDIILSRLKDRRFREINCFSEYEMAVEIRPSTKKVYAKVMLPEIPKQELVQIKLEWESTPSKILNSSPMSILSLGPEDINLEIDMMDIILAQSTSEPNDPKFNIYTRSRDKPIIVFCSSELDHDDLLANITHICSELHGIQQPPSEKSFWATSVLGEVFTFDPLVSGTSKFTKIFKFKDFKTPFTNVLVNGFKAGSYLEIVGLVPNNAERFSINLECGSSDEIALHVNPRFDQNKVVLNHFVNKFWGTESILGCSNFSRNSEFVMKIHCETDCFLIDCPDAIWHHILDVGSITQISIRGDVFVTEMKYTSPKPFFDESGVYWRQIGGHLNTIETSSVGITWGMGFDKSPWVYTGGFGGAHMKNYDSKHKINTIKDTQIFEVYENQRFYISLGFSNALLPTDRPNWSDINGKARTMDSCKLLNNYWHWETDWTVDYNLPGGVDKDGWQYAIDFPFSYHAKNEFVDTARRRKWIRIARYVSTGPWVEVGNTKLDHVSIHTNSANKVCVWAVTPKGDLLFRNEVTVENPCGTCWQHVPHHEQIIDVASFKNEVWVVDKKGGVYRRLKSCNSNPTGSIWEIVKSTISNKIVQIAVRDNLVWARDNNDDVLVRLDVTGLCFAGTEWKKLTGPKMKNISIYGDEILGITLTGELKKRIGISCKSPLGYSWEQCIDGNWNKVSVK